MIPFTDETVRAAQEASAHNRCPARVLKHGRCEKRCPYWEKFEKSGFCSGPAEKDIYGIDIDHRRLEVDEQGRSTFVWHTHCEPIPQQLETIRQFCDFHGLEFEVVKTTESKDIPNWNVCVRVK